jgi:hypothetical protein
VRNTLKTLYKGQVAVMKAEKELHSSSSLMRSIVSKVKDHPLAAAGLVVGTVAAVLPIPGVDVGGVEVDAASASDLGIEGVSTSRGLVLAKQSLGLGAVDLDASECVSHPGFGSCAGALLGANALLQPMNPAAQLDGAVGWGIDAYDFLTSR